MEFAMIVNKGTSFNSNLVPCHLNLVFLILIFFSFHSSRNPLALLSWLEKNQIPNQQLYIIPAMFSFRLNSMHRNNCPMLFLCFVCIASTCRLHRVVQCRIQYNKTEPQTNATDVASYCFCNFPIHCNQLHHL